MVTRLIILKKVLDLDPLFKCGFGYTVIMPKIINWLYYGLEFSFNLSYKHISGSSQKMPIGWEAKLEQIVTRVASLQVENLMENGVLIPQVDDYHFSNTDHVPVYCDIPGNYSWEENNVGNIQAVT